MSWKTRRSTYIWVDLARSPDWMAYGGFVESVRPFLVSLREGWPDIFGDGFFFAFPENFEPADIDTRDQLVAQAMEQKLYLDEGKAHTYLDEEGNEYSELRPELSNGLGSLTLHSAPRNGAPSLTFRSTNQSKSMMPVWRVIFQHFPADLEESTVDAIVEHVFSWWGEPRRAKIGRPSQVVIAAIRDLLPDKSNGLPVLWKEWQWGQEFSDEPRSKLISQRHSHGGVWTIVEGAGELPADPHHPLIQVCAEATTIVEKGEPATKGP